MAHVSKEGSGRRLGMAWVVFRCVSFYLFLYLLVYVENTKMLS